MNNNTKPQVVKLEEKPKVETKEKSPKVESFRLMSWADLEPERMKENKFSKL